jgi:spore coat polysaccharide biosynthesis protein SpsF
MGSSRLPGKVLEEIGGKTMLARVVRRLRRATLLDEVIVASTVTPADEAVAVECIRLEAPCFRGSEEDVLDRYYRAALTHRAEAVVRITADCPFIEPVIVDRVVRAFLDEGPDYASNTLKRTYPRGLDTEVVSTAALERAWREATLEHQRVHVTPYIYQNVNLFRLLPVIGESDYSRYRWTVDTRQDLEFARAVYARLNQDEAFTWRAVLALLEREPTLIELNRHVDQKLLEEG